MAEITYFAAMAFDFIDGDLVADEPIDSPSPAVAIQTAQGQWKVLVMLGYCVQPHQRFREGQIQP